MGFLSSIFGPGRAASPPSDSAGADYRFAQPTDTACISCRHVVEEDAEILYVTHDADDGGWQFLCGAEHTTEEARVVGMGEIVRIDPSVNELFEMPEGVGASRERVDGEWTPFQAG